MLSDSYLEVFEKETGERMIWPNPRDPREIQHRLRYGPPLNRTEQLVAAAILNAYRELISLPSRSRERRVSEIRKALDRLEAVVGD